MKEYIKPFIDEEEIELEDVIATSSKDSFDVNDDSNDVDAGGIFPGLGL